MAESGLERLYALLQCPRCGSGPLPTEAGLCAGCGRRFRKDGVLLDLLPDHVRPDADAFAERYRALRVKEGWAAPSGQEDPNLADRRRWRRRVDAVKSAAAILERGLSQSQRPVVGDIGAGGGWAARFFARADVIAFDLLKVPGSPGPGPALRVRADMRRLPLRDATVDGLLYTAAIHYVAVDDAIREAARVLKPEGLLVAIESPMYAHQRAAERAAERSARYYSAVGYPELARHYHPIDVRQLRAALMESDLMLERFEMDARWLGPWAWLTGRHDFPRVVARLRRTSGPATSS